MTASDHCSSREKLLQIGGYPHMRRSIPKFNRHHIGERHDRKSPVVLISDNDFFRRVVTPKPNGIADNLTGG
jgi:hypothetical protein